MDGRRHDQRRAGRPERRLSEHPGAVGASDPDPPRPGRAAGRYRVAPDLAAAVDLILDGSDRGRSEDPSDRRRGLRRQRLPPLAARATGTIPIAYDNLSEGSRGGPTGARDRLIEGDIADTDASGRGDARARRRGGDALRGAVVGPRVDRRTRDYYDVNVVGTKSVLDAMRAAGVRKILFSSTAATYGFHAEMPLREDSPQTPRDAVRHDQAGREWLIKDYARAYGLGYTVLRYFNAAGADPGGDYGEDRRHESHLIPLMLHAAVGRRPKVMIYGNDYPTRDGTCVARLHPHRRPGPGAPTGHRVARAGDGPGVQRRHGDRRDGPRGAAGLRGGRRPADPARVRRPATRRPGRADRQLGEDHRSELGWSPRYPDIRDIVRTAWEWHRRHPDGFAHGDRPN